VRIPQRHKSELGADSRIGIAAYHAQARYGYAWVCLGEPLADIPELPEATASGFRFIDEFYETWDAPGLRIMENSFDNAHFSYVHQSTFGVEENPIPEPFTIEPTENGFIMLSDVPVKNRELQQRNLNIAEAVTVRHYEKVWFLPFARRMKITYPNGLQHVIFTAATPIDDRRSQLVQFAFRNDTETDAPASNVIAFDRQVTMEDRGIVELCDHDVPLSVRNGEEFHMAADRPGLEMRRRIQALLDAHGEQEVRGPAHTIPPASVTWNTTVPEAAA
jgi:phenylpropionate dioxygenase-like ring-hydroxylating dioxygenase large terminal subunit